MDSQTQKVYRLPEPIRKVNALYMLLAGHELLGLSPGEISAGLNVPPSWVSVNLPALATTGFVERVDDTNRWRLGVPFVRISFTVAAALAQANSRLDEAAQRYSVPL